MFTSASTAKSRSSSMLATPFLAIMFFIIAVVSAVAPGIAAMMFGIAICPPAMGISIAALPNGFSFRFRSYFRSVRP